MLHASLYTTKVLVCCCIWLFHAPGSKANKAPTISISTLLTAFRDLTIHVAAVRLEMNFYSCFTMLHVVQVTVLDLLPIFKGHLQSKGTCIKQVEKML